MVFLFWTLWIMNVLLLMLAVVGKGFRESFGAGVNLNVLIISLTLIVLIASLVLKFSAKQKWMSLVVVALPVLALLVIYIMDKITGQTQ